jgi:hypothetical protein
MDSGTSVNAYLGFAKSSASLSDSSSWGTTAAYGYDALSGTLYTDFGGFGGGLGSGLALGDVLSFAIDFTNKKFWGRLNQGSWRGYGGTGPADGDPVAGTNGVPFTASTGPWFPYTAASYVFSAGDAGLTAMFKTADFAGAPPTGYFGRW